MTEPHEFRRALLDAGLFVDGGTQGVFHRTVRYETLVAGLGSLFTAMALEGGPVTPLRLSPVQPRGNVEASGYITSFPNLVGIVAGFNGGAAQVPEILEAVDAGRDYTSMLSPMDLALCSAACHCVYPMLKGTTVPAGGARFDIEGWCFRHEPSDDPARLQTFRMHEIVLVGTPDEALAHRDGILNQCREALAFLGLELGTEVANDPFFGRVNRLLAATQLDKELKFELTALISSDTPNAISSANYHEEHFGEAYEISTADGGVAHSACAGIGIDRIALALIRQHGTDFDRWPRDVRDSLGLEGGGS